MSKLQQRLQFVENVEASSQYLHKNKFHMNTVLTKSLLNCSE